MKKVLIITYYWPPSGGSGVQRWLKFGKYLPQYGWQPVIYTPSNPENPATDTSLEKEVPAEAVVIRRPISEPYQIYKKLFSRGNGAQKGGSAVVNPINQSGKKSFIQRVSLWVRANLFIPDPRASWVRPSVSYLTKYLEENPVDAIVSTGPPHSMHLIAREFHRRTGIRWVADFRDPWTEIFYFKHLPMTFLAKRRHKTLERSVVREADAVVSVTRQMTSDFAKLLDPAETKGQEKLHTICNGYDEADFVTSREIVPEDKFTLTHTGLFSADGNPVNLWETLAQMCTEDPTFCTHLKLRLIGKVDAEVLESIDANGLTPNLENMGYRPHSEIPGYQQSGWGLLLPLRNEPESKAILTGKFFEYLAAGRPIVAFGPKDGEMAKVLTETHSGEIFEWDEKVALRDHLKGLYNSYLTGIWTTGADRSSISQYSRRSLTGQMVEVLKK
ncbi:MAG: glycosyltransferase [Bacteroidales bacterium]|nr:glycosyltransferase [Bacteroidales bacterium]